MSDQSLQTGEDVEAILKIALRHEASTEGDLRLRLQRSADELGISAEALARAEREYQIERKLDAFMKAKRAGFQTHLVTYISVNALLHAIWAIVMFGDFYWPGIVLAAWGVGIASHWAFIKQRPSPNDPHFRKWLELGEPTTYAQDGERAVTVGVHIARPSAPEPLPEPEKPQF